MRVRGRGFRSGREGRSPGGVRTPRMGFCRLGDCAVHAVAMISACTSRARHMVWRSLASLCENLSGGYFEAVCMIYC